MKSKQKKILATILCMVMVLTNNFSILAEETENPPTEPVTKNEAPAADTEISGTAAVGQQETQEQLEETPEEAKVEDVSETEVASEEPKVETTSETSEVLEELKYEDEQVSVVVTATEEGAIPAGATLKVLPITLENNETKTQYEEVEKRIQEKVAEEEKEVVGFLAYDITFVDSEENKVEPNGKVKVSMDYKNAELPQEVVEKEATDAEVTVLHLEEDENGEVKQVVDMGAEQKANVDTLTTTEGAKVQNVEVETESFSVFTIVWKDHGDRRSKPTVNLKFVDTSGKNIENTLGVQEQKIEISGEGNLGDKGTSLTEIGERYSTEATSTKEEGYVFKKACLDTYTGTEATDISYNPKDAGYWHYASGGKWHVWKENYEKNVTIYLVYEKKSKTNVEEISTISDSEIKINLYNYNKKINETFAASRGFKFHSNVAGLDGGYSVNPDEKYTHPSEQIVKNNYLKKNLKDNYPALTDGTSLKYLFSNTNSKKGVTAYRDLDGLLYNEDGYYAYDSSIYHAQLLENQNRIAVYNAKLSPWWSSFPYGNFLPFNTFPYGTKTGDEVSVAGGRAKTDVWFGMDISFAFMQPKNGLVNGKPMVFEFRGDDDVWAFIDGVKVLDIGGIHDKKDGSINFQTGEVVVDKKTTTLAAEYEKAYKEEHPYASNDTVNKYLDSIFVKNGDKYTTYKNFGGHSFNFYYLERGGGAANCKIKFNIPAMDPGDITISKDIENYDEGAYSDVEFSYELYVEKQLQKNAQYTLIKADGTKLPNQSTGDTGRFTLCHGESAQFSTYERGKKYYVKEVGISSETYDKVTIQSSGIVNENDVDISEGETFVQSKELIVGENYAVTFQNRCAATNMNHLVIHKKLENSQGNETFQMKVTVGGKPYKGDYKVGEDYNGAMSAQTQNTTDGIIIVGANQVAVVLGNASLGDKRGIPSGTSFKVEEMLQENNGTYQTPQYAITDGTASDTQKADGYMGTGYASGKIILEKNAKVIVTNRLINTPPPVEEYDDVPHNKYIDYLGDGGTNAQTSLSGAEYYRLYLDVKGIPNVEPEPADIVLILDYSSSMGDRFSNNTRWHYVKESAKLAVNTLLPESSENRVGIVWFDKRANEKNVEFTDNKEYLLKNIKDMNYHSGTNYQAAFWNAQDMLEKSSNRKKFVVFVTDGEPYQYYSGTKEQQNDDYLKSRGVDKAKEAAVNAAKEFSNLNGFYAVSVGDKDGTAFLKDSILPNVTAAPTEYKKTIGANNAVELTEAFNTFMGSITKQIGNVSITDQLSDYVEFVDEAGDVLSDYADNKNIISGKKGDNIAQKLGLKVNWYNYNPETYDNHSDITNAQEYSGDYTYEIDLKTKTIKVNFGEGYFLERDKVYTISFNIKLTKAATPDAVSGANQKGDANTDYPGNVTSSNKSGLFSNKEATLTYERVKDGEKKKEILQDYEKPVVQPYEKVTWDIVKVSASNNALPLPGAKFTLSQNSVSIYNGESDENGMVHWKYTATNEPLKSSQDIEKGIYTLSEIKAPSGYTLSGEIWTVEITAKGVKPIIKDQGGKDITDEVLKQSDTGNESYVMTIKNQAIYELPSTGGHGIFVYTIGGTLLLMAATLLLYKMKREEVLKS